MTRANQTPTEEQIAAFRSMFDHFNATLFAGTLPSVFLNFSRAANSYGFFAAERWERDGEVKHEISLNPAYLKSRDQREVASTLVHEMVHLWQQEFGKPGRGRYHNAEWADKMETIGLMPSSTAAPGGERTGDRVSHYIVEGALYAQAFDAMPAEFLLPWVCGEVESGRNGKKKPRKASKVKYTCPECGANAWGCPSLFLVCGDCDESMSAQGATDGDERGATDGDERGEERCAA
jgi:predicted RNA-binding Zn-ribbon protein involved in translation (DUF1610 family)